MTICSINNDRGHISIVLCVDHNRLETWFEVHIALYSNDTFKGLYKVYYFSTYRAANNKMERLCKKYNMR